MGIKVDHISFSYGQNEILKDVSFEVADGEFVSVLGPNGVGKSTLFKCMLKLLTPKTGDVFVEGKSIKGMLPEEIASLIAYIPQNHGIAYNFSVMEMVLMGTTNQIGRFGTPRKEQMAVAENALDSLGILRLREKSFENLSGGEQQMVLIARAIAQQARIFVMDEPSANLDFGNRTLLMKTVKSLTKMGFTVIQSTHDPEQAYFYSNKVIALKAGRVVAFGRPWDVVNDEILSELYGVNVEVREVKPGVISCIPKDLHRMNYKIGNLKEKDDYSEE